MAHKRPAVGHKRPAAGHKRLAAASDRVAAGHKPPAAGEKRWDHAAEIRRHYGYREFHQGAEPAALARWLANRAWVCAERPSVLFDLATARLVERKILLPGVTVLARLVAQVRDQGGLAVCGAPWHAP